VLFETDRGCRTVLTDEEVAALAAESKLYREAPPKLDALNLQVTGPDINGATGSNQQVHSTTTVTASPNPKRVTGFFQLDPDIRRQIYFHVLRPDCRGQKCELYSHECEFDFKGCTTILLLSFQAYQESIEVLHQYENDVRIDETPVALFRDMKDFPHPEIFEGAKAYTPFIPPPRLCELHFMRFRKVALSISIPEYNDDLEWAHTEKRVGYVKAKLEAVHRAVVKTTELREIRIIIERGFDSRLAYLGHERGDDDVDAAYYPQAVTIDANLKKALRPLLVAAVAKEIKVSAEDHALNVDDDEPFNDPLVTFINDSMPPTLHNVPAARYHVKPHVFKRDDDSLSYGSPASFRRRLDSHVSNAIHEAEKPHFQQMLGNIGANPRKYQLMPECRTCYELFASWEQLKAHLEQFARHKRS
jgi:hypothetical protein